jgi:hypothetical protein
MMQSASTVAPSIASRSGSLRRLPAGQDIVCRGIFAATSRRRHNDQSARLSTHILQGHSLVATAAVAAVSGEGRRGKPILPARRRAIPRDAALVSAICAVPRTATAQTSCGLRAVRLGGNAMRSSSVRRCGQLKGQERIENDVKSRRDLRAQLVHSKRRPRCATLEARGLASEAFWTGACAENRDERRRGLPCSVSCRRLQASASVYPGQSPEAGRRG